MKKLIGLLLTGFIFVSASFGQGGDVYVPTWPVVKSTALKSDESITNQKKNTKVKTWTERGRKYMEVYIFDMKATYPGMPKDKMIYVMGGAPKNEDVVGKDSLISHYDRIDLIFSKKDQILINYKRTEDALSMFPERTTALDIATDAYLKAKELDVDGKKADLIAEKLSNITNSYYNEGLFLNFVGEKEESAVYFAKAGDLLATGYDSNTDSARAVMILNAGIANNNAKNYKKALEFFKKSLEYNPNQGIDIYGSINYAQEQLGDTLAGIETLKKAVDAYPDDSKTPQYLKTIISRYIVLAQFDEAMVFISKALEKEPNNTLYLYNMGTLYETNANTEKAIEYYKKALAVDADDESSNRNLGIIYVKKAEKILAEAAEAYGTKNYKPMLEEGKSYLKLAYPYLEKFAAKTEDVDARKTAYKDLAKIYSKIDMPDAYDKAMMLFKTTY